MLRVACLGDSLTKGNESLYDGGRSRGRSGCLATTRAPRVAAAADAAGAEQSSRRQPLAAGGGAQLWARQRHRKFRRPQRLRRSAQFDAALAWRPHVALLLLGTNDARSDARSDAVHKGIVRLAARLRKLPSRPALALLLPPRVLYNETFSGLPPGTLERRRTELVLPACAARRASSRRAPASALCTKSSFRLWDTSEALPDDPSLYVGDSIHPSPAGAERLATAVAEKLRHCLRVCEYPGACANNIMPSRIEASEPRARRIVRDAAEPEGGSDERRVASDRTPAAARWPSPAVGARARRRGGASSSGVRRVAEGRVEERG